MRKVLFFILLLPAIAALVHDVYFYTQDQSKGLRFTDLGIFWDTYHEESHDGWKTKLREVEDDIARLDPMHDRFKQAAVDSSVELPPYATGFQQEDKNDAETVVSNLQDNQPVIQESSTQRWIGFVLEQKAVLVFLALAVGFYSIASFFALFKKKDSDSRGKISSRAMAKKSRNKK